MTPIIIATPEGELKVHDITKPGKHRAYIARLLGCEKVVHHRLPNAIYIWLDAEGHKKKGILRRELILPDTTRPEGLYRKVVTGPVVFSGLSQSSPNALYDIVDGLTRDQVEVLAHQMKYKALPPIF